MLYKIDEIVLTNDSKYDTRGYANTVPDSVFRLS